VGALRRGWCAGLRAFLAHHAQALSLEWQPKSFTEDIPKKIEGNIMEIENLIKRKMKKRRQ